jgi:2-oxoglutarate ferredoxin oxidoreductase subunit alpha
VGARGRGQHLVKTLFLNPDAAFAHNQKLRAKYDRIEAEEVRYEEVGTDRDLDVLIVSFGTMARICKTSMATLEERGVRTGMMRPISLYPFPYARLRELAARARLVVSVELSMGQLVDDVRMGVEGKAPVRWYGKAGGLVPTPQEVVDAVTAMRRE